MKNKLLATLLLLLSLHRESAAQVDPHFSQFYAHPLWLNPALTGAFEGKFRATAIYRSQWATVSPYTTAGVSADLRTDRNLNVGLSFLQQAAGDAGYRYSIGGLSVSYSGVRFGTDAAQQVLIGLQLGYLGRSFDAAGLRYGSQWAAGSGYNATIPSGDPANESSSGAFDAAAGITWMDTRSDAALQPFAGVSVGHLTRPEDPFYKGLHYQLPLRYAVHGGARYALSETARLQLQVLYLRQGTSEERIAGAGINLDVSEDAELILGSAYRLGDALAPYAGFRYGALTMGASYDHTISGLSKLAGNSNAFEISLTWILRNKEGYEIPCPRF